jgi:hypothetical protein
MKDGFKFDGPSNFDEQTDAFRFELEDLINRYLSEFDINTFTIMGALQEKIIEMSQLGNFDMEIPLDDEEEEK